MADNDAYGLSAFSDWLFKARQGQRSPYYAAAGVPERIGSGVAQGAYDWFRTPGVVSQSQSPQQPGMWSDEDEARKLATEGTATQWGPQTALSMVGGGAPFAEEGALGAAGGKFTLKGMPKDYGDGYKAGKFRIISPEGKDLGEVNAGYGPEDKSIFVNVDALSKNQLGPAATRDLLRQLHAHFPDATSIQGERVSGARIATGKGAGPMSMDLLPATSSVKKYGIAGLIGAGAAAGAAGSDKAQAGEGKMADFTFTSPEGQKYTVKGPEGATKEEAFGILQQQLKSAPASSGPGKIPSNQPMGGAESFMTGLGDVPIGAKQFATHLTGSDAEAGKQDLAVKQREEEIQRRGGGGIMRGVGAATAGAPAMALGGAGAFGAIPAVAGGAVGGALSGAATPTVPKAGEDYWGAKGTEMATGAALGAGLSGGGRMLGAIFGPELGPDAVRMIESGVRLTPGQMQGGTLRRAEEAMKSVPILGSMIRGAEGRGVLGFNRAVINQALEPIGQSIPAGVTGRQAIAQARDHLNNAYNAVLPNLQMKLDMKTATQLDRTMVDAMRVLPEAQANQLRNILDARVMDLFRRRAPNLTASGTDLKSADSQIRAIADRYRGSSDAAQRDFAGRLDDFRDQLRQVLIQQNPQNADLLKKIDYSYAMFKKPEQASVRRAGSGGVFTPNDLLNVVRQQDKTAGKSKFAQGDALMQDYAEIAQRILPGHIPDSGTPERLMWDAAILGTGGGKFGFEQLAKGAAGMTAMMPYTRPGMAAANWQALSGPRRDALGALMRGGASPAGIGSTSILNRPENEERGYQGPMQ